MADYPHEGIGSLLIENLTAGVGRLRLHDNSFWRVSPNDKPVADGWPCCSFLEAHKTLGPPWNYRLTNVNNGKTVMAAYLGSYDQERFIRREDGWKEPPPPLQIPDTPRVFIAPPGIHGLMMKRRANAKQRFL